MPNERAAIRRAEALSRDPANAGALAFKRSGDPGMGNFDDATLLQSFGEVPKNLDELWRFDAGPAAPLASHDFVALLESAFSLTIFTRLFLIFDALPHSVLQIRTHQDTAEHRRNQPRAMAQQVLQTRAP
jgi:hypothetical protein